MSGQKRSNLNFVQICTEQGDTFMVNLTNESNSDTFPVTYLIIHANVQPIYKTNNFRDYR